jgi:hypothetical protein
MIGSISLDLDDKWSYMKTHGDVRWEDYPSYLSVFVPRILNLLRELNLRITFFIVGKDAANIGNTSLLRQIAEDGHEIGNHSFHHEPWLHLYSRDKLIEEFQRSEEAIAASTGCKTVGFRGPGFSSSDAVLSILSERGFLYDCSTFPTFLGPIARCYYFMHSNLGKQEREQRDHLFGTWDAGFKSLRPFLWRFDDQHRLVRSRGAKHSIVEIPVTTMPWLKVPIHLSYVMYLSSYSRLLAKTYFYVAMRLCQLNGIEPSLLLHPLDFMGIDDEPDLSFFPAMKLPSKEKVDLGRHLLSWMQKHFDCVTMQDHALQAARRLDRSHDLEARFSNI